MSQTLEVLKYHTADAHTQKKEPIHWCDPPKKVQFFIIVKSLDLIQGPQSRHCPPISKRGKENLLQQLWRQLCLLDDVFHDQGILCSICLVAVKQRKGLYIDLGWCGTIDLW